MSLIDIDTKAFPSFTGSVALITGGASGIGLAAAELLLSLGAKVLVCDLNPPPASLLANNPNVAFHQTNVAVYSSLVSAFKTAAATFGLWPDLVFANAGIGEKGSVVEGATDEDFEVEPKHEVINVDLTAVANTARLAWYGMKKRGGGSIVMTSSFAGYHGMKGLSLYSPAKHGVVGMVRSLRYTAPLANIAISTVAPAITVTPLIAPPEVGHKNRAALLTSQGVPLNTPMHVAEAVVWLMAKKGAANGMGLGVQGGLVSDFERNLSKSRDVWMGEKMATMYRSGNTAPGTTTFKKDSKL